MKTCERGGKNPSVPNLKLDRGEWLTSHRFCPIPRTDQQLDLSLLTPELVRKRRKIKNDQIPI